MKTIITPTKGTTPRHACAAGYLAVHHSESEVVLYELDTFNDSALAAVPDGLSLWALRQLGLITEAEYEARLPDEKRRQAEATLRQLEGRLAEMAASVERQRAELEAME